MELTTPAAEPVAAETRDRILEAAHRVFLRRGTAAARTQEIADEAGVNKALLHYYYGSKRALSDAVLESSMREFFPTLFGILGAPTLPLDDKIRRVVAVQIDFHSSRPYLAGYLASEMHLDPTRIHQIFARNMSPPLAVLDAQLRAGATDGSLRPIAVEQFIVTLIGGILLPFLVRPALEAVLGFTAEDWPRFLEERKRVLPDLILAGLRP